MKPTLSQRLQQSRQKLPDIKSSNGTLALQLQSDIKTFTQQVVATAGDIPLLECFGGDLALNLNGRELLLPYDHARVLETGKTHSRVRAVVTRPEFEITSVFELWPDGSIEVTTAFAARTQLPLCSIEHRYLFVPALSAQRAGAPAWNYLWTPHLKAHRSHLFGQHIFRAPALIIQTDPHFIALLPKLELIGRNMLICSALDFRMPAELRYGLVGHRVSGRTFFAREIGNRVEMAPGQSVRFGFRLLGNSAPSPLMGYQQAVRALWRLYGDGIAETLDPQVLTFDDFARYAYDGFFARQKVWRGFELHGRPVGGISVCLDRKHSDESKASRTATCRGLVIRSMISTALPARAKLNLLLDSLRSQCRGHFFGARHNNLRTAYGFSHFGEKWADPPLIEAAGRIINLLLTAPSDLGLIPVGYVGTERWPCWLHGVRLSIPVASFGVADMCETGVWLIHHYRDFERRREMLERCIGLAEALRSVQAEDGSLPAWVRKVRMNGLSEARLIGSPSRSAATAAGGRFFAALADLTHDERWLSSAQRAADFIIDRALMAHEWSDLPTLFSSSRRRPKWRDTETGLSIQSTLPMGWAAELLGRIYRATEEERYLRYGRAAVDQLLLFQQVWNAPFLSYRTAGGFGITNFGAQWSDASQSLLVPLLLQYYELTGERDYFERAVAALRASFVLMHVPENTRCAPGNMMGITERDFGIMPESYGDAGFDRRNASVFYPDWGAGSACAAAAWVQRHYGDLYIDALRGHAFGINGCRVLRAHVSVRVIDITLEKLPAYDEPSHLTPLPRELARGVHIKCMGITQPEMTLWVNNEDLGTFTSQQLAAGVLFSPFAREDAQHS